MAAGEPVNTKRARRASRLSSQTRIPSVFRENWAVARGRWPSVMAIGSQARNGARVLYSCRQLSITICASVRETEHRSPSTACTAIQVKHVPRYQGSSSVALRLLYLQPRGLLHLAAIIAGRPGRESVAEEMAGKMCDLGSALHATRNNDMKHGSARAMCVLPAD